MQQDQTIPQPSPGSWRLRLPTTRPVWLYIFLAINLALFVGMELSGGSDVTAILIRFGANYAPLVTAGEYWRLITANFLHIGYLHLLVNSYALYILGNEVERLFGRSRFVVIYLLSGISGAIFSYMLTQGLSAGASTSLFGLFGALAIFFYKQRKLLGNFGRQRLISLGVTLLINVVIGLSPGSRIDNWGHAGGLIGGVILAWFLCPVYLLTKPVIDTYEPSTSIMGVDVARSQVMDTNSLGKQAFAVGFLHLVSSH